MPNHVKNIVKMKGITALPIFTEKTRDENVVKALDFEKIIPMPESLRMTSGWYKWCIEHWGTKWNSYENRQIDADTITFETAWNAPTPIIAQLAKMHPDVEIEHWWADEDIGSNDGYAKYSGGEAVIYINYDSFSNEAYNTYILCWGKTRCLFKDENGTWHHYSCDDCHLCDDEELPGLTIIFS